jgi:hypothetical protein
MLYLIVYYCLYIRVTHFTSRAHSRSICAYQQEGELSPGSKEHEEDKVSGAFRPSASRIAKAIEEDLILRKASTHPSVL